MSLLSGLMDYESRRFHCNTSSRKRRRYNKSSFWIERLDDRLVLAAMSFTYIDRFGPNDDVVDSTADDFNGDGIVDLAGVDVNHNEAFILAGNGDGTFQPAVSYRVGTRPMAVASADLDGDGDVDLVTANRGSRNVSVLLNNGDGTLADRINYRIGFETGRDIVIADLNADTHLDLAVSSFGGAVGVLLSDSQGGFSDGVTYRVGDAAHLIAGDINADGHFDLVAGGRGGRADTGTLVLINSGDGTFQNTEHYGQESASFAAMALGDLNSDGKLDLAFGGGAHGGCNVSILLGNSDAVLAASGDYHAGHLVHRGLLMRDFNNDGNLDLAVDNHSAPISILSGNGDGTFRDPVSYIMPFDVGPMTAADFNGDDLLDIAFTTSGHGLGVLLNTSDTTPIPGDTNSDGRFDQLDIVSVLRAGKYLTGAAASFAEGDFNGDGVFDQRDIVTVLQSGGYLQQPDGDDPGLFALSDQCIGSRLNGSVDVALGDLDADGDLDAFFGNFDDSGRRTTEVWLNNGNGVLTQLGQRSSSGARYAAVALGDMDGDGDLDAFMGRELLLNDGNGVFENSGQRIGSSPYDVVLGDVDGDGDLDAFLANVDSLANEVWLNDETGVLVDSGQRLGRSTTRGAAMGDIDGDGDLDVVDVADVWLNDGNGQFEATGQRLGSLTFSTVDLADLDGDGDLDAFVVRGVDAGANSRAIPNSVWLNDGQGTFQDSAQTLGNDNSFDVSLADLDGDGDTDALVTNGYSRNMGYRPNVVWVNDGSGKFQDLGEKHEASNSLATALGDVDGDGDIDAVIANWSEGNRVWINNTNRNS